MSNFDLRLLEDLKAHIETRTPQRIPRRRARLVAAGAAAGAAITAGVLVLPGVLAGPAYAVERAPDGAIRISIREYRDPDGLERKLRGFGVDAVIDYLPSGKQCREPRATYAPNEPDLLTGDAVPAGDEKAVWLLHPDKIRAGQTLVYTVWLYERGDDSASSGRWQIATGAVAPCELVPGGPEVGPRGVTPGD
jgi:hypothetical protein